MKKLYNTEEERKNAKSINQNKYMKAKICMEM